MAPAEFPRDVVAIEEEVADFDRMIAALAIIAAVLLLIVLAAEHLVLILDGLVARAVAWLQPAKTTKNLFIS